MTAQETILFCIVMGTAIASLAGIIYMRIQLGEDKGSHLLSDNPEKESW